MDKESGDGFTEVVDTNVWHEYIDQKSGCPYYHNFTTEQTSWEPPSATEVPTLVSPDNVKRTLRPKSGDLEQTELRKLAMQHASLSHAANQGQDGVEPAPGEYIIPHEDTFKDLAHGPDKGSRALRALQGEMDMLRRIRRQTEVVQDIKGLYQDAEGVGRSKNLGLDWEMKAEMMDCGDLLETDYDLMREIFDDDYRRGLIGNYAKALLDTSPERPDDMLLIDDERYDALRQYYQQGVRDFLMDIEYEKFFLHDKDRKAFEDDYLRTLDPKSDFGFYRNDAERWLVKYIPSHFVVPDDELRASPEFQNYRFHKVLEKHANNPDYLQMYYKPKAGAYIRITFFVLLPIVTIFWLTHTAQVEHTAMYRPVKFMRKHIERGKRAYRRWFYT